jgi:hypothetical protein
MSLNDKGRQRVFHSLAQEAQRRVLLLGHHVRADDIPPLGINNRTLGGFGARALSQ